MDIEISTEAIGQREGYKLTKVLYLKEYMMEIEEMAQLSNGGNRHVKSMLLSRTACLAIALNADKKKAIVKATQEYFTGGMTSKSKANG